MRFHACYITIRALNYIIICHRKEVPWALWKYHHPSRSNACLNMFAHYTCYHAVTLTLYSDIHTPGCFKYIISLGSYTGVYSCCTPLDVHYLKDTLLTDYNSLRTQPLYIIGNRSQSSRITIQVKCISFIESGIPRDYYYIPGDYNNVDTSPLL